MVISKMVKTLIADCFNFLLAIITSVFKVLLVLIIGLEVLIIGLLAWYMVESVVEYSLYQDGPPWELDYDYAYYINNTPHRYGNLPGFPSADPADTVDALRIYKVTDKFHEWYYSLRELFEQELVFETKDRRRVKELILASRERTNVEDSVGYPNECSPGYMHDRAVDRFYVVMFDNTFKRAGYFLVKFCQNQDKEYVEISVPDKPVIDRVSYAYSNKPLFLIFRAMHLL